MVDRLLKATVVDLDGTYLSVNSLHFFIKHALKWHLRRGHLCKVVGMVWWLTLRRLKLTSHRGMKFNCLAIAGTNDAMLGSFRQQILRHIREDVRDFVDARANAGDRILLATAAADTYVRHIWDGEFIATPMTDNPDMIEYRGEEKARQVTLWLNRNRLQFNYVLSDHLDDAPLFRINTTGTNILVHPNKASYEYFCSEMPDDFLFIENVSKR